MTRMMQLQDNNDTTKNKPLYENNTTTTWKQHNSKTTKRRLHGNYCVMKGKRQQKLDGSNTKKLWYLCDQDYFSMLNWCAHQQSRIRNNATMTKQQNFIQNSRNNGVDSGKDISWWWQHFLVAKGTFKTISLLLHHFPSYLP